MPISHDNRPAQRLELSFLSVTADSPVMDAIKSYLRILHVTKECIQFLDSGKTILHFAYSRYCIIDNNLVSTVKWT